MISLPLILAQAESTFQLLSGIENIGKLGVAVLAVLVSLGVILIAWSNSRGSNKMTEAILKLYGDTLHQQNQTKTQLDEQEKNAQQRHEQYTQTQTEQISVLKQLVGAVGTMKDEVVAMRNDNKSIQELQRQIDLLQKTAQHQANQLEAQSLEVTTLRESNEALKRNLEAERTARAKAEAELVKEREIARQNEERNTKAVQLLKDQFNALQKEFDSYKAKVNNKTNKEATLKNDLSQHSEQSDSTNE
jgi:chromosome segregation ATPase